MGQVSVVWATTTLLSVPRAVATGSSPSSPANGASPQPGRESTKRNKAPYSHANFSRTSPTTSQCRSGTTGARMERTRKTPSITSVWTTTTDVHRIAIPLAPGTFLITNHTGESTTSISANHQSLTIEVSTAPIYVRRDHAIAQ